ncbi:MAG: SRPBCC family protein [Solirubrobacteraceae bacterium]
MTEHREQVLRIERVFDAPVERVFEAWTSEEVLRRWIHAAPDWETPTADVELRVGGTIRIVMRDPSDGAEYGARGEYTVVEAPHRVVFTWVWDDDRDTPQLIELELTEVEGATTVVMTNSAIPSDGALKSQRRGWHLCYDNLERLLSA